MKFPRGSLYLKLLAIYGVTFFLIVTTLTIAIKASRPMSLENSIRNNLHNYASYLAADIGTPPNLDRAQALQKHTRLDMAIIGPGVEWTNDPHLLKKARTRPEIKQRRTYMRIEKGGYVYVFGGRNLKQPEISLEIVLGVIFAFALILTLSYRLVKFVIRPIQDMKAAASAFGEGKWETRIQVRTQDELADLGQTMNNMAEKIDAHFKNMKDLLLAISHELRSPLTRMKVTAEFISDEKIRSSLNDEINILDRMTGMLLERERMSSRPELLEKVQVSLSDIVQRVAKKYPEAILHLPIHESIKVDENRFELALNSIIDNAYKHGKPPVEITAGANHEMIWLEIKDHGQGISKESLTKLGEPFFRQSEARTSSGRADGFGLGLSLAYSIFKAHGFTLTARSDEGTTFRLEMPRALFLS